MSERRVLTGALGCSNCRDRFPIADGAADLRPPPRAGAPAGDGAETRTMPPPAAEASAQLAALLGVAEGPGYIGLVGPLAVHAGALADAIPDIEVVAAELGVPTGAAREGVSRARVGPAFPFAPWTFRALAASTGVFPVPELLPALARGGRIVLERPDEEAVGGLERAGVRLLLRRPDWIVALKETA